MQGVMSPQDARAAVDAGVDGIVLSNHGGRQLDHSPAPLDMVAAVRAAIGYRVPLLMDGGIRRGTDVLKVCHDHDSHTSVCKHPCTCPLQRLRVCQHNTSQHQETVSSYPVLSQMYKLSVLAAYVRLLLLSGTSTDLQRWCAGTSAGGGCSVAGAACHVRLGH